MNKLKLTILNKTHFKFEFANLSLGVSLDSPICCHKISDFFFEAAIINKFELFELEPKQKNSTNHLYNAFYKLLEYLTKMYNDDLKKECWEKIKIELKTLN